MATYDLDRTELNHLLSSNIDAGARAAVVDYLLEHGGFEDDDDDHGHDHNDHGHHDLDDGRDFFGGHGQDDHDPTVKVQISDGTQGLDPKAQVLDLTSASNTVTTDAALKVIVENVAGDANLTVHGENDVMIVTGDGNDHVTLQDSGNDIVLTGSGNDVIAGLKRRGVKLEAERLVAIATSEYPTKAARPKNSRLDHQRLNDRYGIVMPSWHAALALELDELTGVAVDEDGFRHAPVVPEQRAMARYGL